MRISIITTVASIFSTVINSASLVAAPIQPDFQVNSLRGQTPSRFVQPNVVQTTNADPELEKISRFFNAQKQLAISNQASPSIKTLANSLPVHQITQTDLNSQTTLSEFSVRLSESNTPRQILPTTNKVLMKQTSASAQSATKTDYNLQTARQFLNLSSQTLRLNNPEKELTLTFNRTDNLGKQHLRFNQFYQQIPVWKSALTVHMNKAGDVELVDGVFYPSPKKLSTTAIVTAQQAIEKARLWIPRGADATQDNTPQLTIYPEHDKLPRLAWEIKLSAGMDHQWLILVDAHNGTQILAYNQVNDVATTGSGTDLFGKQQQLNVFEDSNQFYLADTSKPMYKGGSPFPLTSDTGVIYILDDENQATIDNDGNVQLPERLALASSASRNNWPKDAVSAAFTLSATYDYFSEVHSRNSIDGNGGSIFAVVRVGTNYANAFWNGQVIAFGDAIPFAGALDIVGHELTHGVIQNTSNLIYLNQSGALNEALSDIFGEAIEAHSFGQADWATGAQTGSPLRSLLNPRSLNFGRGRPYPASMSEYVQLPPTPEGDLGGIHINSTIIGHAFYLLAEGLNGAIGINDAEQIFYRAMTLHLVPRSRFLDARLAVIQSASELYGDKSTQALKAAEAFDTVEIFDAPPTPASGVVTTISGSDATIFIEFDPRLGGFYLKRRDPALNDTSTGTILSFVEVSLKRPSVDHNTGLVAFVDSSRRVCTISSTNGREAECLTLNKQINSVAISSDGQKIAVVFRDQSGSAENTISVIYLASNTTQVFSLVAPASEGASTSTVVEADEMDFSNDGQFLIYDAFNAITTADGSRVSVWSIYSLDLVNETIIALVPPVKDFHFAFPALSQTTDDYLTFDAYNEATGTNTITASSLITGKKQSIGEIKGFSVPSYNGDDDAIIYSRSDIASSTTNSAIFRQSLEADQITPSGAAQLWLRNADYGVIYRRGNSITTQPSSQQSVAKEGLWWIPSKPGSGFDIQLTSNNDLFMIWYTYTRDGQPLWYLASGPLNGSSWSADIFEFTWDGSTAISNRAGKAELNFQNNTHATLNWTLNTGNGSTDLEYFVFGQGDTNTSGTWYDKAQPGYGLTQVNQGSSQVKVLYFYDQAGNPRWVLGSGASSQTKTTMNSFSGSCPVCVYESSVPSAAGTVTASYTDQQNGKLSTDIFLSSPLLGSWQIFGAEISNLSE